MRQFQFIFKIADNFVKVSVDADITTPDCERFTIMDIQGAAYNTEFQKFFPWWKGSVISRTDLNEWFKNFRGFFDSAIEYGNSSGAISMGNSSEIKTLTITPTILNGNNASLVMKIYNPDGIYLKSEVIELSQSQKVINVLLDYIYNFSLNVDDNWTSGSAPADIVVDDNEMLSANITIKNNSAVKILSVTPTLTNGTTATIRITGVKDGYANDVKDIELGSEVVEQAVYAGYTYSFSILTEGASWTDSTPADKLISDNDSIALAITLS